MVGLNLRSEFQSSRRSPSDVGSTEKASNRFDRDRTGMPASGLTELAIRIPNKLATTKSGYISGTEMATFK